jgi:flagellar hook assembly protein FlgD
MPSGFYSPTWDGRDDSGAEVSSGVYFAKITTPEGEQTAKVVLTR